MKSHLNAMLTKRELSAIRKALPIDGYKRIAEKAGVHSETVRKVLNEPKRFNQTVIGKALEVIEEFKSEVRSLKNQIKEV